MKAGPWTLNTPGVQLLDRNSPALDEHFSQQAHDDIIQLEPQFFQILFQNGTT